MSRTTKLTALVALIAMGLGVRAADPPAADQPFDDATFVKKATIGGIYEVVLGRVVASQAKNDDVKNFAERMVKDHTAANEDLKAIATAAGFEVPMKLDEKHQAKVDSFKTYKGTDLDQDYVKDMVKDHEKDVDLFTRASKQAKNPAIKDFATKTLPTLQKHLEMVRKLEK